jgi:biopolymer transport protein ExbD
VKHGAHYLWREWELAMPLVGLVVAVLLLATAIIGVRSMQQRLHVEFSTARAPIAADPRQTIQIRVEPGPAFLVDEQRMATLGDVEERLGQRASSARGAVIRFSSGVPAEVLMRVLEACSRAGLSSVAMEQATYTP